MGIQEVNKEASILIYLNPTKGLVSIINFDPNEMTTYQIYNYLGELIQKGTTAGKINIETLNTGIYLLSITGSKTLKIIKQ